MIIQACQSYLTHGSTSGVTQSKIDASQTNNSPALDHMGIPSGILNRTRLLLDYMQNENSKSNYGNLNPRSTQFSIIFYGWLKIKSKIYSKIHILDV